jgi:hypothetical protein
MVEKTFEPVTAWQRERVHLIAMCDGKGHGFVDHAMANLLRGRGLIKMDSDGRYTITNAGKKAVVNDGY